MEAKVKVAVIYAGPWHVLLNCQLEEGSTVQDAIDRSGVLNLYPEIDLKTQKVGVYGKFVKLDSPLSEGDRVEIYRRITRVLDDDEDDDDDE